MLGKLFKRAEPVTEIRSSGSGYTAQIMAARESYVSGRQGLGDLTATVQACVSLWENGLTMADVDGTNLITPRDLALIGRSLALRGEALLLIRDYALVPCSDWDLRTRDGVPTAYRVSISEAGGGRTETALAGEVLHIRTGMDVAAPYHGQAPLRRASITAGLLHALERALREVFENAPLGSQVLPVPENKETDNEHLSRGFRGRRGGVLIRESVNVMAAGGPTPLADWNPNDLSPNLSKSMTRETLAAARDAICAAYGVLPGMLAPASTGPMVREGQRHLAQWMLQPLAVLISQEASEKLGIPVTLDLMRPLQAFDAGGRARAASTLVQAMTQAKEAGVDPSEALKLVDWD